MAVYTDISDTELAAFVADFDVGEAVSFKGIAEGVENELVSDQIRSLAIPLGQGFGLGRPTAAADLLDSAAAWRTRDTLRPLRPRNVQARAHSGTSVQEREGSTRRDGIALPVNPSRRSLDVRQRRTVKGSGDAPPGRAS